MESELVKRRNTIISTHCKNPRMSQRELAKQLKIPKSTIQNVLLRFKNGCSVERQSGSGRKRGSVNVDLKNKVLREFKRKPNTSVRDMANKLGTSKSNVQNIKTRARLSFNVQKIANSSETQESTAKTKSQSTRNSKREGLRKSHRTANSSRQESDKEETLIQSNLTPSTSLHSKRDEESEEISESGAEVLSSGSDLFDVELNQFPKTAYFSPSSSAELYNTGVPSCLSSSDNWPQRNETEVKTSPLNNPTPLPSIINDACTKFFLSMADTVRDLPPDLQIIAKRNVLHEVTECELTALNRLNTPNN